MNQARFLRRNILERIPRERLVKLGCRDDEMVGSVTSEDDDGSPQHLEGTGVGEGETNVLETGGRHITQSWGQKYLNNKK